MQVFQTAAGFFHVIVKVIVMKPKDSSADAPKKKSAKKDISASYNKYKTYGGKQYTGMKIGRSHKWYYDQGVWKEKKVTPDRWEIHFEVTKRRAGKAPEGSGAPVGTEYNWFILAHQHVKKLDANSYSTELKGEKFKIAHKRFDSEKWSSSDKAQKKKLIKVLQQFIEELQTEDLEIQAEGIVEKKPARKAVKKAAAKKKAKSKSKVKVQEQA